MEHITFRMEKLVRDNVPDHMSQEGSSIDIIYLSGKNLYDTLLEKLYQEEFVELKKAINKEMVVSEGVDILQIIQDITNIDTKGDNDERVLYVMSVLKQKQHAFTITDQQLKKAVKRKFKEKGGFNKGAFIKSITFNKRVPRLDYFIENYEVIT